jgi:hypothetical protein
MSGERQFGLARAEGLFDYRDRINASRHENYEPDQRLVAMVNLSLAGADDCPAAYPC